MRNAGALLGACVLAGLVGGCVSGPREYDYSVDLRNVADRPVTLELLRIERGNVGKVRADLAPGGRYMSTFTAYDSEYLEVRLRQFDSPPDAPFYLCEIPKGRSRRDITLKDGKLVLMVRPPNDAD